MKTIISSCFIVLLKIFEPVKSNNQVLFAKRFDINNKKR